jgi:antitoxin Phd
MNKHTRVWSLQDAKAKFSEVVRLAQTEGPQIVTVHGREAVTITKSTTDSKIKPGMSALEALNLFQSGPPIDFDIPDRETDGEFKDPEL